MKKPANRSRFPGNFSLCPVFLSSPTLGFGAPISRNTAIIIASFFLSFVISCTKKEYSGERSPLVIRGGSTVNLGNIPRGTLIMHRFFLETLPSTGPIDIIDFKTGCVCTEVTSPQLEIKPNASIPVDVKISTVGRIGPMTSIVHIFWKTAQSQEIKQKTLLINLNVTPLISCSPLILDLGDLVFDKSNAINTIIQVHRENALPRWDTIEVQNTDRFLRTKLVRRDPNSYEIEVSLKVHDLPIGTYRSQIVVQCLKDGTILSDQVTVPIIAEITSSIKSKPTSIYLGVICEGKSIEKKVDISWPPLENWTLVSSSSTDPSFARINESQSSSNGMQFTCKFNPAELTGNRSGTFLVTLKKSHQNYVVSIPFISYIVSLGEK